jgi:hypothetical protein
MLDMSKDLTSGVLECWSIGVKMIADCGMQNADYIRCFGH